jgi:hypothetical protein
MKLTDDEFDDLGIMSDQDLRHMAKRLGFAINKITFAEDLDPDGELPYGVNVINLGDNDIGGTHWTLWYVPRDDNKTYYFDSFGGPPEDNIVNFSFKHNREVVISSKQIQQFNESHCGVWSLLMGKVLNSAKKEDRKNVFTDFVNNSGIISNIVE